MRAARNHRLDNLLGAAATGLADAIRDATTTASGLDEAAATTLVVLLDFSPHGTVRRLSEALGVTHSGAVRLVDRLEAAGYVVRRPGDDARSLNVSLTDAGREVAEASRRARHAVVAAMTTSLSAADREHLTTQLERIVATLTEQRLAVRRSGGQPASGALCRLCDFAACGRPQGRCPAASTAAPQPS